MQHLLAGDRAFADQAFELLAERRKAVALGDLLDGEEADVVAVAAVFVPGIAEADDQMHRLPPGEMRGAAAGRPVDRLTSWPERPEQHPWPEPRQRRPWRQRPAAAHQRPEQRRQPARQRRQEPRLLPTSAPTERRWSRWSGRSRASARVAPAGRVIAEMWIESPMSLPVRSTVSDSGMASAGTESSTVWCTMLSTPPFLMPGLCVLIDEVDRHLDVELGVGADAEEIHVHRRCP